MSTSKQDKHSLHAVGNSVNTALEDLKVLVRDAEEILASAGDAADDKVVELKDRLRGALKSSRSQLRELQEAAREHIDEADQYVRTHPYQSIGVAVALGAVIGLVLARRKS